MARITVNPEAEVNVGFDLAAPGIYRMRFEGTDNMAAVTPFTSKSGNECLKVRAVFADPTLVSKADGTPVKNLGGIIDNSLVVTPADKQGKLRSVVEAVGLAWADFDTDDLNGKEFMAKIGVEEYNGDKKNVIARYLPPSK